VVTKDEPEDKQFRREDFRLKAKADPTWHTEMDDSGKVIFVNRKTGESQPQKPEDWDGEFIIG